MPDFQLPLPKAKRDYIEAKGYFRKSGSSFYIDLGTVYFSEKSSEFRPQSHPLQFP